MEELNTSAITVTQNTDTTKLDINFTPPTSNYLKKIYLCRKQGTTPPTNAVDSNFIPIDRLIKTINNNGYNTGVNLDTSLPYADSGLTAGTDYSYRSMAYFLCNSDVNKKSCRCGGIFDFNGITINHMIEATIAHNFVDAHKDCDIVWWTTTDPSGGDWLGMAAASTISSLYNSIGTNNLPYQGVCMNYSGDLYWLNYAAGNGVNLGSGKSGYNWTGGQYQSTIIQQGIVDKNNYKLLT
jgi:hypothetical protein